MPVKVHQKKLPVCFAPNQTLLAIMDCLSTCIFTLTPLLITFPFDFMWISTVLEESYRDRLPLSLSLAMKENIHPVRQRCHLEWESSTMSLSNLLLFLMMTLLSPSSLFSYTGESIISICSFQQIVILFLILFLSFNLPHHESRVKK